MKRGLDLNKLKNKEIVVVSTEEALKDVVPISWDEIINFTIDKEDEE